MPAVTIWVGHVPREKVTVATNFGAEIMTEEQVISVIDEFDGRGIQPRAAQSPLRVGEADQISRHAVFNTVRLIHSVKPDSFTSCTASEGTAC